MTGRQHPPSEFRCLTFTQINVFAFRELAAAAPRTAQSAGGWAARQLAALHAAPATGTPAVAQ
ncbi:hypothetical protein PGTUg99_016007 [Puccinia graminis f. sp. tritici]|uniref:Uncharacterized protein n=1 Tax=Puccinia graminis f. sp. tritici TaxID=56615 RepID=A0A5B0RDS4_PUCGR|nr:hypothetical protein PGTUg99_016007 [Puccinia graminis f. sp. tritici]